MTNVKKERISLNILTIYFHCFSLFSLRKECQSILYLARVGSRSTFLKKWTYPKMRRFLPSYSHEFAHQWIVCVESYTNTKLFPDKSSSTRQVFEIESFFLHPTTHCMRLDRPSWSQRVLFSVNIVDISIAEKSCSHRARHMSPLETHSLRDEI